ncbi:hypothetical protein SAMN05216390_11759 [Lachnospiraceae bacterium KH1T2]|nr:hypothetical protein SAMN05216390_11759 [Lachnospiraceae bacterium KH1T2]
MEKKQKNKFACDEYIQKLASVKENSGLNEAIVIGKISIARIPVAIGVMDVGYDGEQGYKSYRKTNE